MLYSFYLLRDAVTRANSISDSIQRQIDKPKETFKEDAVIANARAALLDIQTAVDELSVTQVSSTSSIVTFINSFQYVMEDFERAISLEDFRNTLNQIQELIGSFDRWDDYGEFNLPTILEEYGTKYRGINTGILHDSECARIFARALRTQSRPLKVFDMNTRSGYAAQRMKDVCGNNIELYGADIYGDLRDMYRPVYHRTISGELKGMRVRISQNAFDAIYLDPSITWEKSSTVTTSSLLGGAREEQVQLIKATGYLRENGVLCYIIPRYRIYKDTATYLATHYNNLQILTSREDIRFRGQHIVMIMGTKRVSQTGERLQPNPQYYTILRELCNNTMPEEVFMDADRLEAYTLPISETVIENFRGAKLSEEEAAQMMINSQATANFWKDQTPLANEAQPKHPLLPFSVGQLGLVLTSGVLDGVVDEGDGHYHVVRGRVKRHKTDPKDEEKVLPNGRVQIERTSVTSNVVELSVIGPDGSYKKLAG